MWIKIKALYEYLILARVVDIVDRFWINFDILQYEGCFNLPTCLARNGFKEDLISDGLFVIVYAVDVHCIVLQTVLFRYVWFGKNILIK